jgi:hypothetical protein
MVLLGEEWFLWKSYMKLDESGIKTWALALDAARL